MLRMALRRCLVSLHLHRAARRQRYHCRYSIAVPREQRSGGVIICPLPPTVGYQQASDVRYDAAPTRIEREGRYGNSYALWEPPQPPRLGFTVAVVVQARSGPDRPYGGGHPAVDLQPDRYFAVSSGVAQLSATLWRRSRSISEYLRHCYDHVVSSLSYGHPILGLYSSTEALKLPRVDCGGFDALLGSLLLARRIPARLVAGFWANADVGMHAWLEARLPDGRWLALDPSVDHLARAGRTRRTGGFGFVGSDRIACSFGSDLPVVVHGQTYAVPLLQHAVWLRPKQPVQLLEAKVQVRLL